MFLFCGQIRHKSTIFRLPFFLLFAIFALGKFIEDELSPLPIVQTENGLVQGFRIQLEPPPLLMAPQRRDDVVKFQQADIFLGIPFAQAPLNSLRLERPKPATNWTETLDATSIPPACVPQHILAAPDFSEDCLRLNIFRPFAAAFNPSIASFPVLVFIHGGGFAVGGTFVEGYANISNNFVSQGILVVTIQYRVSFLGFFSDGMAQNAGNLGLWDQRQALIWIRQNVAHFGGNPDRVTIWGQSAGASSVSLLSISPKTRGWIIKNLHPILPHYSPIITDLFQQAIQISGSFLCPWTLNDRVVEMSMKTAKSLGCAQGNESANQKECLKRLELDDLVEGIQQSEIVRSDFAMVVYNPRLDGDLLPLDNGQALGSAPAKPTLMGFNSHESLFLTIHYPAATFAFDSPLTVMNMTTYNRTQLVNFIRQCVKMEKGMEDLGTKEIANQLAAFYADERTNEEEEEGWRHFLKQYTLLLTDIQFIVPFMAEARMKAADGWPIHLFQFDHVNREHAKKLPFRGVVHGGEYPYTLGPELFGNYVLDEEDREVQAKLIRTIGTFVLDGHPSLPSSTPFDWPSLDSNSDSPLRIVRFNDKNVELEKNPPELMKRLEFWRKLARKRGFFGVNGFPKAVP